MAREYKVLGQEAPSATTDTDIYTVGASKQVVVSSITVCNRSSSTATYRIAVRTSGDTLENKHYIAFDAPIGANDTVSLTLGLTASETDVFTVYASSANLSFGIFGTEVDVF
jgi:uncharacterized membrane protein